MIYSNIKESGYNGSFATLILECEENNMRIFNAILEAPDDITIGGKGKGALHNIGDIISILGEAINKAIVKIRELISKAKIKINELLTGPVAAFAKDFKKNIDTYDFGNIGDLEPIVLNYYTGNFQLKPFLNLDINEFLQISKEYLKTKGYSYTYDSEKLHYKAYKNALKNSPKECEWISSLVDTSLKDKKGDLFSAKNFNILIEAALSVAKRDTEEFIRKFIHRTYTNPLAIENYASDICDTLINSKYAVKSIGDIENKSIQALNSVKSELKDSLVDQSNNKQDKSLLLKYINDCEAIIISIANANLKVMMTEIKRMIKTLWSMKKIVSKGAKNNSKDKSATNDDSKEKSSDSELKYLAASNESYMDEMFCIDQEINEAFSITF